MRDDLLLSQARGNGDKTLIELKRNIEMILDTTHLLAVFNTLISNHLHIAGVVSEYGDLLGIVTMEDILEYLIGYEIVDEHDRHVDMQQLAKKLKEQKKPTNHETG